MAEFFETISVPLVGALDTKSAAAAISPENLAILENGDYGDVGLVTRPGYAGLSAPLNVINAFNNNETGVPKALFGHDNQLCLLTSNRIFTKTGSTWVDQGFFANIHHTARDISTTGSAQHQLSCASTGLITVYAWASTDNAPAAIVCAVVDEVTGAAYATNYSILTSNGRHPNTVRIGDVILVTWINTSTNNIDGKIIQPADVIASLTAATVTIRSDVDGTRLTYAICEGAENALMTWMTDGSVFTGMGICQVTASATAILAQQNLNQDCDLTAIAYNSRVGQAYTYSRRFGTSTVDTTTRVEADLSLISTFSNTVANVVRLAIAPIVSGNPIDNYVRAYETDTGVDDTNQVVLLLAGSTGPTVRHCCLAAAGHILDETGNPWFLCSHASRTGLQNAYFLVGPMLALTMGPVLAGNALGVPTTTVLPNIGKIDSTHFVAAPAYYRRLETDADSQTFHGMHKAGKRLDFYTAQTPQVVQIGRSSYITGSQLWLYDGVSVHESGFNMFPDMLAADFVPAYSAGYNLTAGTYSYRVYYESISAAGERTRSAALTIPVTLSDKGRVAITIPTLAFTDRTFTYSSELVLKPLVAIVVYRSKVNDTSGLHYRVSSTDTRSAGDNKFLANDASADSVSFVDNMLDTTAATKEYDYQSVGGMQHINPPAPGTISVYRNRLIVTGGEIPRGQIRFSKERLADETVQFSDALTLTAGTLGDVVALATLNETPIVFEEEKAHVIVGSGLDNTGGGSGWDIQNVSVDTGCNEVRSVVQFPGGLMFKSDKGIYQMGPDYQMRYIGAPVELFNGNDVISAEILPESNQVIFQSSAGRALVFDYFYNKWSTYKNHYAVSACAFAGDQYAWLRSDYTTMIRDTSVFTDAGSAYSMRVRTGKFNLGALQDYMKISRLGFLGEYFSPHRLRVGIIRDRDPGPYEEFYWEPDDVLEVSTWGGETLWGDAPYWGGSFGSTDYRYMHRPKLSKYEEIALEFTSIPTGDPGQCYSLTEIIFEVAKLPGQGRISAMRKV